MHQCQPETKFGYPLRPQLLFWCRLLAIDTAKNTCLLLPGGTVDGVMDIFFPYTPSFKYKHSLCFCFSPRLDGHMEFILVIWNPWSRDPKSPQKAKSRRCFRLVLLGLILFNQIFGHDYEQSVDTQRKKLWGYTYTQDAHRSRELAHILFPYWVFNCLHFSCLLENWCKNVICKARRTVPYSSVWSFSTSYVTAWTVRKLWHAHLIHICVSLFVFCWPELAVQNFWRSWNGDEWKMWMPATCLIKVGRGQN